MSTVLWANHLLNNDEVASDESDKGALYKHADKLDKLAGVAGLELFSSLLDHTDMQFNVGDDELPDGIQSTNDLIERNGVWKSADDALGTLNGLLTAITTVKPRFGVLKNDYDAVVDELSESIEYAKKARNLGVKFNFSVVMGLDRKQHQNGMYKIMNLNEMLDLAFEKFISNTVTDELLKSIKSSVTSADVDTLIIKVESLDDPSVYSKNDLDSKTPAGFFLFLDFISALIINIGNSAIQETEKYSNNKHHFVHWVVKYASDERFHNEIISKFSNLFVK